VPKRHDTNRRLTSDFELVVNDDGSMPGDNIRIALLYDIRRATERTANEAERQTRVLRRIDRRLAKRVKLR